MEKLLTRIVFILALVAVLARAAIPAGYMPDLNSDTFKMVICTIDGAKTVDVDGNFDPDSSHSGKSQERCDFNIVNKLAFDTPDLPVLTITLAVAFVAFQLMRSQIARRTLRLPSTQSRAPPSFSF